MSTAILIVVIFGILVGGYFLLKKISPEIALQIQTIVGAVVDRVKGKKKEKVEKV